MPRRRALRAEIEVMEAQYRQIFYVSSAGIFVLDTQGRLINGNPTVLKLVGLSLREMRELAQAHFLQWVFAEPAQIQALIDEAREYGRTVSGDLALVDQRTGTRWVHCLVSVQRAQLAQELVEGVIYDITERLGAEAAARHQANHDALTGLTSRRASVETLEACVAATLAGGTALAVLGLDLDGFKQVNDQLGHNAGDEVLRECALRLAAATRRGTDLVGRLDGDEFLIVLRGLGPDDPALSRLADKLLCSLAELITLQDGRQVQVGVNIGIACLPLHGHSPLALTEAADAALYLVKRHGKRCHAMALLPGFGPPTDGVTSGAAHASSQAASAAAAQAAAPAQPNSSRDEAASMLALSSA